MELDLGHAHRCTNARQIRARGIIGKNPRSARVDTDPLAMPHATPLSSLPPRYQAQAAAQLGKSKSSDSLGFVGISQPVASEAAIMLRQSSKGMNKTEALFLAHLKATHPDAWIEREPFALKLGNGVRYNPDFAVWRYDAPTESPALTCYEVKGHMRDDAAVKLKVAASKFHFARFVLVWRDRKSGGWKQQVITP